MRTKLSLLIPGLICIILFPWLIGAKKEAPGIIILYTSSVNGTLRPCG
jgi:hypothetical protein